MSTVNSVSGGKTSAYLAAHYPADFDVFALVRIEDPKSAPKDPMLKREAERRTGQEFIATAEDDLTLYAVLDLEQFIGRTIHWVTGLTYDEVIRTRGGWLPNMLHRYCTVSMKLEPLMEFYRKHVGIPPAVRIGFRANEMSRAQKMLERCDEEGVITMKCVVGKWPNGNNRWDELPFQIPEFPLIRDRIYKDRIEQYWKDKPVRFAPLNNCVGCFNREPLLLRKMFTEHPEKMEWFASQEQGRVRGAFRSDIRYERIAKMFPQLELNYADFSECDSGHCGV